MAADTSDLRAARTGQEQESRDACGTVHCDEGTVSAPRRLSRQGRQTRLRRTMACTVPPSAASTAHTMRAQRSGGSAGSAAAGDMPELRAVSNAAACSLSCPRRGSRVDHERGALGRASGEAGGSRGEESDQWCMPIVYSHALHAHMCKHPDGMLTAWVCDAVFRDRQSNAVCLASEQLPSPPARVAQTPSRETYMRARGAASAASN